MAYLPPDVFTHILDELDPEEDVDTLRSLSLCCSDLRPISQRKIFYWIYLNHSPRNRQYLNKILRFLAVLQSSPWIADYVRHFTFCFLPEDLVPGPLSTVSILGMILSKLRHVKSLALYAWCDLDWEEFYHNDANQDLSQEILGVLPSIIFLEISGITRFPLHIMARRNVVFDITENATSLATRAIPDNNFSRSDTQNPIPFLQIRNYYIGYSAWPCLDGSVRRCLYSAVDPPFFPFDFSRLQHLRVRWQEIDKPQSVIDTGKIMNFAPMLKEFTCEVFESTFEGLAGIFHSHIPPSLTTLNVKVELMRNAMCYAHELVKSLYHELSDSGGYNHLERLSVTIDLPEYATQLYGEDLQCLDVAICQANFRSLKAVNVILNIFTTPEWLMDEENFLSKDELATYLGQVHGRYFRGLQSMQGLIFSCKVNIDLV